MFRVSNAFAFRLALSYNRLTVNSFSSTFNTLTRLRYLNLKGNRLTAIPQVVSRLERIPPSTRMRLLTESTSILQLLELPSLEILDVSKNDLAELPEDPGRLVQLRVGYGCRVSLRAQILMSSNPQVFALSYNKLRKLPGYFVHFANLKVLVVEHNPIEWPVSQGIPKVLARSSFVLFFCNSHQRCWIINQTLSTCGQDRKAAPTAQPCRRKTINCGSLRSRTG